MKLIKATNAAIAAGTITNMDNAFLLYFDIDLPNALTALSKNLIFN